VRFAVTLERGSDSWVIAWVQELPGCFVRGPTSDDVETALPEAIASFASWAGEPVTGSVQPVVVETVASAVPAADGTEAILRSEHAPLDEAHWARLEGWLARSRSELESVFDDLDDDDLARPRPDSSWTIGGEIQHLAFVELMYAMWTFDLETVAGLRAFTRWSREAALARMRALAATREGRETRARWSGAPRPEPWTPRTAARRLVWHELLHVRKLRAAVSSRRDAG
jgi:hypothetical protein